MRKKKDPSRTNIQQPDKDQEPSPALARQAAGGFRGSVPSKPLLSSREIEVIAAAGIGEPLKSTANRLGVSIGSVQSYRQRAMLKLGLKTDADMVKFAAAFGLASCPCQKAPRELPSQSASE